MRGVHFITLILLIVFSLSVASCFDKSKYEPKPYVRPLEIVKLSDTDYLHISYLKGNNGGYIPCNGYVKIDDGEAVIFDTPINDTTTKQLINFIKDDLEAQVVAAVVSHFHEDAAGGLQTLKDAEIPTYVSNFTLQKLNDASTILNPIAEKESFTVGNLIIESGYYGAAHTQGDLISYIPRDSTLIGGCAVKPIGGRKGNLSDAVPEEWANTIQKVRATYLYVRQVIPGHGAIGDHTLLEYTEGVFKDVSISE